MHEDPTRLMGPEGQGPDGGRPRGNMRLLVAGLIAVIVGLVIAVIVIAGNDNGASSTASTSESVTDTAENDRRAPARREHDRRPEPTTTERPAPTTTTHRNDADRRRPRPKKKAAAAASKRLAAPMPSHPGFSRARLAPLVSAQPPQSSPTASYEADPAEVHRVLLLYSGGLDTSVMLKWIQDSYEAEVVCLTVNLGQPGEDYEVIEAKARQLGAVECHVVDARERFADEFLAPAIKANAVYGNGYPLFTALGRPLIAQLAVEYARESGCDTIAHGCTGKGNDQVRIEATVATLAPELRTIARCAPGRWAARRRSPTPASTGSRSRAAPRSPPTRSTTTSGAAPRRVAGSRTSTTRPRTTSSSSSPAPRRHPTRPRRSRRLRGRACRSRSTASGWAWSSCSKRAAEIGCRHGVGIVDHIEDRIVGLKVRDIYEVPGRGDRPHRPRGAGAAGRDDPPEPVQAGPRPEVGLPRLRRALVGAAAHRPRRLHGRGQRPGDRRDRPAALQRKRRGWSPAPRPTPSTTPSWPASRSPAASSRRPPRRASSSSGRCSRGWPTGSASAGEGGSR